MKFNTFQLDLQIIFMMKLKQIYLNSMMFFKKSCYPSTFDFSDSSYFSKSKQFSSSFIFSNSDYLPTSTFSSSRKFSKSEEFEATNQFSESNIFTLSNSFSQTYFNSEILNEKTFFKSYLMTNVTVKAVVFSCSNVVSSTFILSYDKNEINAGGLIVSGFLGPAINMSQQIEHQGVPKQVHITRIVYELVYCGCFVIKERC